MKIDTSTIQGYAEMTADQKIAALEAFEYEDNTAEIERLKNANSKANGEAAEWKRKHNALLSEDEQKKQKDADEKAALMARVAELEKDKAVATYTNSYISLGYEAALAKETAEALQSGDMQKVFENGEKHRKAMEQKIKEDLMKSTPRPGGNGGDDNKPDSAVEQARQIGKQKAAADKTASEVLSHYLK